MVARSPLKVKKMVAPINPILLRETLMKVDRCMSRLQELQNTVSGGTKVVGGVNLSPGSSRGYLRTSLRCKQESLRNKSPVGKLGDWRRMSLPAMLLGETMGEIIEAGHFAKEIVEAAPPNTPLTVTRRRNHHRPDNTELRTRRKREKHNNNTLALASSSPRKLERVRSRINFKKTESCDKEKERNLAANRVSPKLKPWAKKAVLFPNPLFLTTPSKAAQPHTQKFCKTRSPMIGMKREAPHKFLIKSPPKILIKSPPKAARPKSSPALVSKLRRSFSPSRLASRLVSPLKSRKSSVGGVGDGLVMSGFKQRPLLVPMRHSFVAATN